MSMSAAIRKRQENRLRNEAKGLARDISLKYWELGRVLHQVYSGIPGGYQGLKKGDGAKRRRKALFEKWGYKNFGEYCEKEIGINKRTAENLRFAYHYFAIRQELTKPVIGRLIALGRSKVYLLSGVATRDNIGLWIKKAKDCSFEDLRAAICLTRARASTGPKKPQRSLRIDVCAVVKYLYTIEHSLRRVGKKIPDEIQAIMKWYQDQMDITAPLRMVA
jgi:hypothetical protein